MLLEAEMVRRRDAAIVTDASTDPRVSPLLLEASGQMSYVAAPLMPEGRVVGFLHADYRDARVTSLDRDVLAAFARAFDQIFERAVLLQRLNQQRDQMRSTIESVSTMLDDLASAEIELVKSEPSTAFAATRSVRPGSGAGTSRLEVLLTKREIEVLALMSTGATNDRIAERLVISSDTVKSHVKHILRKLRAENRAEAIAQYLRATLERGED
jgi:DNA-binding CsgD family transcriptional regulator